MRYIFFLVLSVLFYACDDGDLQIETIDFEGVNPQTCNPISVESNNVLFKINSTEALILQLPNGAFVNEVSTGELRYNVTATGTTKITYRTFSDNVSSAYFCNNNIPLTTPSVIEEIIAQGGEVLITTALNNDGVTYEHKIELESISLVTSNDTRITNLEIKNFGTVTTTKPE